MESYKWLESWYLSKCNGLWEHGYGVKIDTLDNPGWVVRIDLYGTELMDKQFEPVEIDNSESDWISCRVRDNVYEGGGDPTKLEEIFKHFREWVEK